MRTAFVAVVACAVLASACSRGSENGASKAGASPDASPGAVVAAEASTPDPNQAERQRAAANIAPVIDPTTALIGPEGSDAEGRPLQIVDRAAVRALLVQKKYVELTAIFAKLQDAFEADPTREDWPMDAADAFDSAEPKLLPGLDAWVAASPDSFAPYLARGTRWTNVAYARRGAKWAKDTPAADLAAMKEPLDKATADLDKALTLRPKLVAALREKLRSRSSANDSALLARALKACPTCFRVRVTYMYGLTPRWGGSYAAMDAFAKKSVKEVPTARMKVLGGFVDFDKASLLRFDKKVDDGLVAIQRACAAGEYWEFLGERAKLELEANDVPNARTDIDRAAVLRPGAPEIMTTRAYVSAHEKKYEQAGLDLLDALRIEPTRADARSLRPNVVDGLVYEAYQHEVAGRRTDALRVIELGIELAPDDARLQKKKNALVSGGADASDGIDALEDAALRAPDDFEAHQRLDYALARQGNFNRVVTMWTEYLTRHPSEGRAYLERGGAYFSLKQLPEAFADAKQACSHGSSEGCTREKQLAPMMK